MEKSGKSKKSKMPEVTISPDFFRNLVKMVNFPQLHNIYSINIDRMPGSRRNHEHQSSDIIKQSTYREKWASLNDLQNKAMLSSLGWL